MYTFDVTQFHKLNVPYDLQWWVFLAFFLGFAIKVPMFPFHTWLPDAHTDAPTAGSVILAAVLLKMGTYGFLRFSLPILPDATRHFVPMIVLLCIIGIVYGALVALAQKDWKRLVAYSSVSHMAMVMLGMFALNPVGITGSIIQQLNHGISTGALFLLVGVVYERRHTREISEYGGLSKVMPVYAAIFLVMTMSSIGLPTLNGFIGEFLILQGVFVTSKVWAAFAASGVVLGAAYMLYLYQRTMFGKIENPKNERLLDLSHREFATFAPLLILAVWMGLYPAPFLRRLETSVQHIVARVSPQYAAKNAADCDTKPPTRGRWSPRRRNTAAKFLAPMPCDLDGKPLAGRQRPARRPGGADAARALAQRFLLHPAGAGAHGGCAARAHCRRPAAARQQGAAGLGHAAGHRRHAGVARAVCQHPRRGGARAARRRSVRAVLQGACSSAPPRMTVLMSVRYLEIEGASPGEYYFLILCATLGMMIMAGGIDLITHLHRPRDDGGVVLHPGRVHQAEPAVERSGGEVFPARRVFARASFFTACR